jgi:hypothetical protein
MLRACSDKCIQTALPAARVRSRAAPCCSQHTPVRPASQFIFVGHRPACAACRLLQRIYCQRRAGAGAASLILCVCLAVAAISVFIQAHLIAGAGTASVNGSSCKSYGVCGRRG